MEELLALIPLLRSVVTDNSDALGKISLAQWTTIGTEALRAGPQVIAALAALHPALQTLSDDLAKNKDPQAAATTVNQWIAGLQNLLNAAGANPPVPVDGLYGKLTTAAVRAFQSTHYLVVDGIAGTKTMSALVGAAKR